LKSIALGNSWVNPVASVNSYAPFLLQTVHWNFSLLEGSN
jgi:hypothetical protein